MSFLYPLINILLLAGGSWVLWQKTQRNLRPWFFPALGIKLASGIILGLIYQYYFKGGDTFEFQKSAQAVYEYFRDNPSGYFRLLLTGEIASAALQSTVYYYTYSNSFFVVLLLSVLNLITGGSYYLNGLYFSLFSFYGCWQLTQMLTIIKPQVKLAAIVAFLLFPSVVFWSSGITKEAIYLGALSLFITSVLKLQHEPKNNTAYNIIVLSLTGYLLWKIKFFFAIVVYPLFGAYICLTWLQHQKHWHLSRQKQYVFSVIAFGVMILVVSQLHHLFELRLFFFHLMDSYTTILKASVGKPIIYYPDLKPTIASVLWHAPQAIWHATFRPYFGEGETLLYQIAGLESLFLMLLLLATLGYLIISKHKKADSFIVILLIYCFVVAILIGLTTPNLGTLNRYRVAYLPFLIYSILQFLPLENLTRWTIPKLGLGNSQTGLRR